MFSRRGVTLRDLGSYLRGGVNVGIGTDTYPHNMLEEMRHAGIARPHHGRDARRRHVRRSVPLRYAWRRQAARAHRHRPVGVGAKPDVVLVDLTHPMMQPRREPLRSLIYAAAERAVKHVFVAGRQVVKDGKVLTMDYAAAAAGVNESQRRALAKASSLDWAGRTIDELSPPAFRHVGSNSL